MTPERKERRGFASMSPERQREIASKGGRAAHEKGTAHEWTAEEARRAGRKGGQVSRGGRGRLPENPAQEGQGLAGAELEVRHTPGHTPGVRPGLRLSRSPATKSLGGPRIIYLQLYRQIRSAAAAADRVVLTASRPAPLRR